MRRVDYHRVRNIRLPGEQFAEREVTLSLWFGIKLRWPDRLGPCLTVGAGGDVRLCSRDLHRDQGKPTRVWRNSDRSRS